MIPQSPVNIYKSHLSIKMWVNMVVPTMGIILTLLLIISLYFNNYVLNNSLRLAADETNYVASALNSSYTDLLNYFVRTSTAEDFLDGLGQIASGSQKDHTAINNLLQGIFSEYSQLNKLLDSCLLASGPTSATPGMLFHSYKLRMDDYDFSFNLGLPAAEASGMTILRSISNPFVSNSDVIPIVIPLHYKNTDNLIAIADTIKESNAILYLFISTTSLADFMEIYCNDNSEGCLYLVDHNGVNISQTLATDTVTTELSAVIKGTIAANRTVVKYHQDYIFIGYSESLDRYVVNQVPESLFKADSNNLLNNLYFIAVIIILLVSYLSIMINHHVAKPLTLLMQSLHEIETQTYQDKAAIATGDEIGQLNEAIHSMSTTIQKQILMIKQEEKEKYDTRFQLLTEQVNPHFLYNALEFINMEVYNKRYENVSDMITSLGRYLRISLSYGENEILISQEIEQVMAYVRIMNYRFHNSIQVSTDIPEWLLGEKIIKCLLQPLVENSLKHGFQIGNNTGFPFSPMISIAMIVKDDHVILTVSDNGVGIDIEKASWIMHAKQAEGEANRHFGLHNIYQRLCSYYGDATIDFTSIPYFENSIIITLPASFFI